MKTLRASDAPAQLLNPSTLRSCCLLTSMEKMFHIGIIIISGHIKAAWLCHPAEPHLEALKSYTFCNTLKVNGSFTRLKKAHFKNFHFCTQFHHKCFGFIQKALYAILLSYGTYAKIVFSPHRSTSFTHIAIFSSKQKIMVA